MGTSWYQPKSVFMWRLLVARLDFWDICEMSFHFLSCLGYNFTQRLSFTRLVHIYFIYRPLAVLELFSIIPFAYLSVRLCACLSVSFCLSVCLFAWLLLILSESQSESVNLCHSTCICLLSVTLIFLFVRSSVCLSDHFVCPSPPLSV